MASATYDAYVPCTIPQLLAAGGFKPTFIPFHVLNSRFNTLNSEFHATRDHAQRLTAPAIFVHCIRVAHFAFALLHTGWPSGTPGVEQISFEELTKRIYLAAILHDISMSYNEEVSSHPAHTMSFELQGGIMAYEHLNATYPAGSSQELNASQIGDVVQGIILHTSHFDRGMSTSAASLIQLGAHLDVFGFDFLGPDSPAGAFWNREMVKEIFEHYPRGEMASDIRTLFVDGEVKKKPNCLLKHGTLDLEGAAAEM